MDSAAVSRQHRSATAAGGPAAAACWAVAAGSGRGCGATHAASGMANTPTQMTRRTEMAVL
jgi:hypothetical protein